MNEALKKRLTVIGFLVASGGLAYLLNTYVINNPALNLLLAPAINYVLLEIKLQLEGYGINKIFEAK